MKALIGKILWKARATFDPILIRICERNNFLSSFYYFLFSTKFWREHKAVLSGKKEHLRRANKDKSSVFTLIRNTHRLEKGLLMKPRRDIFAVDFIKETMDNFETLYSPSACSIGSQIKWSCDVLSAYFDATTSHPIIDTQRARFKKIVEINNGLAISAVPYHRVEAHKPVISFEEFYTLTKYRRSVRWFLAKKVPHDLVDKALLAAIQSPSACNRQPFEYRIIDSPSLLSTVANIPGGVRGYAHNIPMFVVVIGNLDAYFDERDRHVIYIDASLANMAFMFALETLGLSSCAINWPDVELFEKKMEKALNLTKWQRPIMCIAVGYPDPDGMVAFSEKRNLEEIRKYN